MTLDSQSTTAGRDRSQAAALSRDIKNAERKIERLQLAVLLRKQKLNRLLNLIVADVATGLPADE